MRLTEKDRADIQAHIDFTLEFLDGLGLELHSSGDMRKFADCLASMPGTHGVASTHDPNKSHLTPENSFWLYATDRYGDVVYTVAHRRYVTDNFLEECLTETVFQNRRPSFTMAPLRLTSQAHGLMLSGNVVMGGGMYARPNWRGKGLAILTRCSRSIALRHFLADYVCGTQYNTDKHRKRSLGPMAYRHSIPCFVGGLPLKEHATDVLLSYSSRREWLEAIRLELAGRYDAICTPAPRPFHSSTRAAARAANSRA